MLKKFGCMLMLGVVLFGATGNASINKVRFNGKNKNKEFLAKLVFENGIFSQKIYHLAESEPDVAFNVDISMKELETNSDIISFFIQYSHSRFFTKIVEFVELTFFSISKNRCLTKEEQEDMRHEKIEANTKKFIEQNKLRQAFTDSNLSSLIREGLEIEDGLD